MKQPTCPFLPDAIATGAHFTDRAVELKRIRTALSHGGAKLLIRAPRRLGKTSLMRSAVAAVRRAKGLAVMVDFSTATTPTVMIDRLLGETGPLLETRFRNWLRDFLRNVPTIEIKPEPDATSGHIGLKASLRLERSGWAVQREALYDVLDQLNADAERRKVVLGIAIDEMQLVATKPGAAGARELFAFRNRILEHRALAYVLAGSDVELFDAATSATGAFHETGDVLALGPIDPGHFAEWIDDRLRTHGVRETKGIGAAIIERVGPRTRDVVRTARAVWFSCVAGADPTTETVDAAIRDLVADAGQSFDLLWEDCTAVEQGVMLAIASGVTQLTSAGARDLPGLATVAAPSVSRAASALVTKHRLARIPGGYGFDNPFFARWVRSRVLGLPELTIAKG